MTTPDTSEHDLFLMQFFKDKHHPEQLHHISGPFAEQAGEMMKFLPRNPERTMALRKLLEAKDCAVRCFIAD